MFLVFNFWLNCCYSNKLWWLINITPLEVNRIFIYFPDNFDLMHAVYFLNLNQIHPNVRGAEHFNAFKLLEQSYETEVYLLRLFSWGMWGKQTDIQYRWHWKANIHILSFLSTDFCSWVLSEICHLMHWYIPLPLPISIPSTSMRQTLDLSQRTRPQRYCPSQICFYSIVSSWWYQ